MKKITYITSNKGKLAEVKKLLPQVDSLNIDLPEIQEIDLSKIIDMKLAEAMKHVDGCVMVEDTGLFVECLGGLPGPFVKWFLKSIGSEGLAELVEKYENGTAVARTMIGYWNGSEKHFFVGEVKGRIVKSRGGNGFGWDGIFEVEGTYKTYAEMSGDEKNEISHRRRAVEEMNKFTMSNEL